VTLKQGCWCQIVACTSELNYTETWLVIQAHSGKAQQASRYSELKRETQKGNDQQVDPMHQRATDAEIGLI
jgi:hypothetical protein